MSRAIDADALFERACNLEAQALAYVGKIVNDESKIEEWRIWSAILAERTAFKHDIFDAPEVKPEPHWIPCSERLPKPPMFCLVSTDGRHGDVIDIALYMSDGWHKASTVTAWMPLPEPYREGEA